MTSSFLRALIASTLLLSALAAAPSPAADMQFRGANQNLEEARALVAKGRFEEALQELVTAEQLPGNTNRHLADIYALRASALLGLGPTPEHQQLASDALFLLWHIDPQGSALASATQAAKDLAQEVRTTRPLVLHDRLVTVRTGQPIRVRARLSSAPPDTAIYLHYRAEADAPVEARDVQQTAALVDSEEYVRVQLEPAGGAYEVYLRPGVGGVPAEGDHVLRYYLEALAPDGSLLDSNGSARQPIRVLLSQTRTEGAGVGGADAVLATLDEGGKVAHPEPPPPPETPIYKRWQLWAPIGGVVVAGVVIGLVVAQPRPQPPNGSLGRVDLP